MAEIIINYTSGTSVNWTNDSNAWDKTNDTYATRTIPKNDADDSANYLKGTAHDNVLTSRDISKVEIGVEGKKSSDAGATIGKIIPIFNGTTDGSTYSTTEWLSKDVEETRWVDITSDGQAPGTWTWTNVDNLDFRMYGLNEKAADCDFSCDQLYLRVTYTPGWGGKINGVTSISKINGISIVNIKSVNGVE